MNKTIALKFKLCCAFDESSRVHTVPGRLSTQHLSGEPNHRCSFQQTRRAFHLHVILRAAAFCDDTGDEVVRVLSKHDQS